MLRAVAIKTIDCHDDGEFLPGLCAKRKTHTDGDRRIHLLGAGLGVIVRDEVFSQWSIMKSDRILLEES